MTNHLTNAEALALARDLRRTRGCYAQAYTWTTLDDVAGVQVTWTLQNGQLRRKSFDTAAAVGQFLTTRLAPRLTTHD